MPTDEQTEERDDVTTLADRVDAEEARVEAELAAEAETEGPEPEEPGEPDELTSSSSGPSDADLRKFESENARHERALAKIVGDDWRDFEGCGVCDGVGFVPAAMNADSPLLRDKHTETCADCDGYGATRSGAKPPAQVEIPCNGCGGKGWNRKPEHVAAQPVVALEQPNGGAAVPPIAEAPPGDPAVAELRSRGYIVVEPPVVTPAPGS